ncbi:methyl-accepting chemotaxis protein [Clostridium sp. 19966]|uniref:methyl-accepting chemotaxis protein n=1 Tax=Clostridium sp. 19966 TaxID=2768166 RepID=UPI0028DDFF1A|nr:methyl-accepting chemotaxis protein [Clostridium sp. 19966]MDT8717592.1 methyl-accepting chemotaxis protein [Clostridium sp. 19966]
MQGKRSVKLVGGVKAKLLIVMFALSIIPVIVIGFTANKKSQMILENRFSVSTQQTTNEVNREIDNYFQGAEGSINMLTDNSSFAVKDLSADNEKTINELLKNLAEGRKDYMNVYFGRYDKKMIIYPVQQMPDGYDPTSRPWYQDAVNNDGKIIYTDPYKDVTTNKYIISIAKAVKSDGQVIGVLSIDLDLTDIAKTLSSVKIGSQGYIFITTDDGLMIAHPTNSELGKNNVTKISVWNQIKAGTSGMTEYTYNGSLKYLSYSTNKYSGWKVIASMPKSEITSDTDGLIYISLGIGGILVVVTIVVSILFSNSITTKILALKAVMNKVSEGDLSSRIAFKSKDEFAELANNFNDMLKSIETLVSEVKQSAEVVTVAADSITSISKETTNAVNEVALTTDQVANGSVSQAEDISSSVSDMENLAGNMDVVVQLTGEIERVTNEANELSENGTNAMGVLMEKTEEVNVNSKDVMFVMGDMNEASEKIGYITNTINSIAEQTNLLALNAAIEAARAGEAGKGFSVVADEIRKLAEQSSDATKQIQELISGVIEKSRLAVSSMEKASEAISAQNESVNTTKDIFSQISETITLAKVGVDEIVFVMGEANNQKQSIVDKLHNISAVSEESSASTEELTASLEEITASMNEFENTSDKLKILVGNLEKSVERFKI